MTNSHYKLVAITWLAYWSCLSTAFADDGCTLPEDLVNHCPLRDAGPKLPKFADFASYRSRHRPVGRAIVYGSKFQFQDNFSYFDHDVGSVVFTCKKPAATLKVPCPNPTWEGAFTPKPSLEAVQVLVAIWSDSKEGWASTKVYKTNPANMENSFGDEITTYVTPPAGIPPEITPTPIPGGSDYGRYFVLTIAKDSALSTGFTYRSSLPSRIKYAVQTKVVTEDGTYFPPADSRSTDFKPALGFTTSSLTGTAGACFGPLTVSAQDGNGQTVATLASNKMQINFHVSPAHTYLDNHCKYPTDLMYIQNPVPPPPSGQRPADTISTSVVSFYINSPNIYSAFPVTAEYVDTDKTAIFNTVQNQVIQADTAISTRLTGPGSVPQSACSSAITIAFLDRYGNAGKLNETHTFSIAGNPSTHFFVNSDCSGSPVTQLALGAGATGQTVYASDTSADLVKILLSDLTRGAQSLQGSSLSIRVLANGLLAKAIDKPHADVMAQNLFRRLTGVPAGPTDGRISQMSDLLLAGKVMDAAAIATKDNNFYNIKVRALFTPMSNRLQSSLEPLSDFVTTGIGYTRDNIDARKLLTGNQIYVGKDYRQDDMTKCTNTDVFKTNQHFLALDAAKKNLATELVPVRQCAYSTRVFSSDAPIPTDDYAGLLTSRKWGLEHVIAGTNRRAAEFAFKEFNCLTMSQLADNSVSDWRVRRDVDHAPGGDPSVYHNSCVACHATLDQAAQAFAFHDFYQNPDPKVNTEDARLFWVSTGGYGADSVMPKMNQNSTTFPPGWIAGDNSWMLNLSDKQQKLLGIDEGIPTSGNGVNSFGNALANSKSFRQCFARRAFKLTCLREAGDSDQSSIDDLANYFADTGYNLRNLIERSAVLGQCLGNGSE